MTELTPEIESKLDMLEAKIDALYVSTEKTRKILKWTGIITIATFVIPLLLAPLLIPLLPAFFQSQGVAIPGL